MSAARWQLGGYTAAWSGPSSGCGCVPAELIWAAIFLGILLATWPSPPWDALLYGGVALMVILPFLFFPFSKTLFLAFDLVFRPPGPNDFS